LGLRRVLQSQLDTLAPSELSPRRQYRRAIERRSPALYQPLQMAARKRGESVSQYTVEALAMFGLRHRPLHLLRRLRGLHGSLSVDLLTIHHDAPPYNRFAYFWDSS
jgi:hypothetical protein